MNEVSKLKNGPTDRTPKPYNILICPDKFKGSLSARAVARAVADGIAETESLYSSVGGGSIECSIIPLADGGEGTYTTFEQVGFSAKPVTVLGPLGKSHHTQYYLKDDIAYIELADGAGLALCGTDRSALTATSFGVGQMMDSALRNGARHLIMGIGGTASTDGGAGILEALGGKFLDEDGVRLRRGGGDLARLHSVHLEKVLNRFQGVTVTVLADVDVPLLGENGAARMFSLQKGASPSESLLLEKSLRRLNQVVSRQYPSIGSSSPTAPGTGSGGGAGYALINILGGKFRLGVTAVMELLSINQAIDKADLVVTGEGSLDTQTLRGKVVSGVCDLARSYQKPVVVVAGQVALSSADEARLGALDVYALTDFHHDIEFCIAHAGNLLNKVGREIGRRFLASRVAEVADL